MSVVDYKLTNMCTVRTYVDLPVHIIYVHANVHIMPSIELHRAAVENDVGSLKAWSLAKVDLNMADYNGQTALKVVCVCVYVCVFMCFCLCTCLLVLMCVCIM